MANTNQLNEKKKVLMGYMRNKSKEEHLKSSNGTEDGSMIKITGYSCRETKFDSQHTCGSFQQSVIPVPGNLNTFFRHPKTLYAHTNLQGKCSYIQNINI